MSRPSKEVQARYWRSAKGKAARIRHRQKRLDYVNAVKLNRGCADCGYNLHHAALEYDHIRGKPLYQGPNRKRKSMGTLTIGLEKLAKEIAKCDVVCANCHAIRTYNRRRA